MQRRKSPAKIDDPQSNLDNSTKDFTVSVKANRDEDRQTEENLIGDALEARALMQQLVH
jgi:hypothetical protein